MAVFEQNARPEIDTGVYTCVARNSAGAAEARLTVIVTGAFCGKISVVFWFACFLQEFQIAKKTLVGIT